MAARAQGDEVDGSFGNVAEISCPVCDDVFECAWDRDEHFDAFHVVLDMTLLPHEARHAVAFEAAAAESCAAQSQADASRSGPAINHEPSARERSLRARAFEPPTPELKRSTPMGEV